MENTGQKIKKLRIEKGLTQENLANYLCVSRTLIAKFESGVAIPSKEYIKKICIYLDADQSLFDEEYQIFSKVHKKPMLIFFVIASIIVVLSVLPIFMHSYYDYENFVQGVGEMPPYIRENVGIFQFLILKKEYLVIVWFFFYLLLVFLFVFGNIRRKTFVSYIFYFVFIAFVVLFIICFAIFLGCIGCRAA